MMQGSVRAAIVRRVRSTTARTTYIRNFILPAELESVLRKALGSKSCRSCSKWLPLDERILTENPYASHVNMKLVRSS
jgi:hypothetical protein